MSRHRFVRNLELANPQGDYEALSDGGEDEGNEITPEQLAQMNSVREHIRAVIGGPKRSGISDKEIDDSSWEYYFDLDQTMDHILEIQGKRNAAKERQVPEENPSLDTNSTLSKLQKLSLAKQAGQANPPKSLASLARAAQAQRSPPLETSEPSLHPEPSAPAGRPLSKLALLASKGKATATSPSKATQVPGGLSKIAQKVQASRMASSQAAAQLPQTSDALPSWDIGNKGRGDILKASNPSHFAAVLTSSNVDNAIRKAAKEREKQEKMSGGRVGALRAGTPKTSPKKGGKASGAATPVAVKMDQMDADMLALNLQEANTLVMDTEEPPKMTLAREKLLEEARRAVSGQGGSKQSLSIVIIGHVDAGKSTLVGRLMYDLGSIDQRKRAQTERSSEKSGKASFSWAWEMDSGVEERNRGITIDMAHSVLSLPNRTIVVLDAPGHKDFVPNMISGAAQADTALLVVDATNGEFEAGFEKGGQTREHLLLVRSLGVQQLIVAVNKLDMVAWSEDRFNEITETLGAFLTQSGFQTSKTSFVPVAGFLGVNLVNRSQPEANELKKWYSGPTLVDILDKLDPPGRSIEAPFRFPITNMFKGQTAAASGVAVSGRLYSGVIQVGERVRVVPGDETAVIKSIMADGDSLPWAVAGSNVDIYLTGIDPVHLTIGSVLCPLSAVVPLAASFTAQVIIFDQAYPITIGASVELFHHSQNIPATVVPLEILDRITGATIKSNPRVLSKGMSAKIRVSLRGNTISDSSSSTSNARLPIETFKDNKDMGRVLLRRNGETMAAGIVLTLE